VVFAGGELDEGGGSGEGGFGSGDDEGAVQRLTRCRKELERYQGDFERESEQREREKG
jgi:hypothetical protein